MLVLRSKKKVYGGKEKKTKKKETAGTAEWVENLLVLHTLQEALLRQLKKSMESKKKGS